MGDGKLRHPADAAQWGNIDAHFPWFEEDCRNIRFAMSTDGVNPFGNQSSTHSTWPVMLSVLNLSPWLCKKHKYLMLSILVSGPKQPGDRIDVYLRPLVDDIVGSQLFVTVLVKGALRFCAACNGHAPVTFILSFVTR